MNLLIFGATGGTGIELVQQALALGYGVTAFARDPGAVRITHPKLQVVRGDVTDENSVQSAFRQQQYDAVMSALGSPLLRRSTAISDGVRHIIRAMYDNRVQRFIFESSIGVGSSKEYISSFPRRIIFPTVLRHIMADKVPQEQAIMESTLDWTIVRPAQLNNGPRTGTYRHGSAVNAKAIGTVVSRADVAAFMLEQVVSKVYLHQCPCVSN